MARILRPSKRFIESISSIIPKKKLYLLWSKDMCLWIDVMAIFLGRFMEQRLQKLNNSEQPSMEDSLPLPIERLRTAPATRPQKRVSNISSDSVVNSHVLSPAMPITPDNSQPYHTPSTSRTNLFSGPLTPIQQFINKSCKSKAREPKYSRSRPDHPDPQSVLRTRTRQVFEL